MRVYVRRGAGALNCTHDTDSHRGAESTVRQHIDSVVLLPRDRHMMSPDKDGSNSNIFLTQAFCKDTCSARRYNLFNTQGEKMW